MHVTINELYQIQIYFSKILQFYVLKVRSGSGKNDADLTILQVKSSYLGLLQ